MNTVKAKGIRNPDLQKLNSIMMALVQTFNRKGIRQMNKGERIWQVVSRIPRGKVATYGQVARLADLPGYARYGIHDENAAERQQIALVSGSELKRRAVLPQAQCAVSDAAGKIGSRGCCFQRG